MRAVARWVGVGLVLWVGAGSALAAVGRTSGSASVSPSGTAEFAFPLSLPPGTRGLTPQLGLSYSSAGGRGIVGVGWAISGVSVIARCERTVAQDGLARPVQNDSGDAFCLNGNKLRVVSGVYGAAGSTYRLKSRRTAESSRTAPSATDRSLSRSTVVTG